MSILKRAIELVTGNRGETYTPPIQNFTTAAKIWSAMINEKHGVNIELTAEDVGLMMAGFKLARECGKHQMDNLIDMAGYVECVGAVIECRAKWAEEVKNMPERGQPQAAGLFNPLGAPPQGDQWDPT